jgi:hypothetical protein
MGPLLEVSSLGGVPLTGRPEFSAVLVLVFGIHAEPFLANLRSCT